MNIYLDIETAPRPLTDEEASRVLALRGMSKDAAMALVKVPASYKKPESIAQYCENHWEQEIADRIQAIGDEARDSALDPNACIVTAIAWAVDDGEGSCLYNMPEDKMLVDFCLSVSQSLHGHLGNGVWVAHNGKKFDFPILWRRACKYNVPALQRYVPHLRYDKLGMDTMEMWNGTDWQGRTSLATIAKFLGIEVRPEKDADMLDAFRREDWDLIKAHCVHDVELLRTIYKRINF